MKAFAVSEPGAAPAHHDLDLPEPGEGEVRVRVAAASVNGFDLAAGAGYMAPFFEYRYPVVLGREYAGVVDALGAGVEGHAVGDRVFGVVAKPYLAEGAFAEYTTAVAADGVAPSPASLTDSQAAALGHTGSTALTILDAVGPGDGKTFLIAGATGGIGTLLVQLAAASGWTVIATGRTPEGRTLLEELGAAHAVDYADLETAVRAIAPDGVDAATHLAGDASVVAGLVRDGGTFASPVVYDPSQLSGAERLDFVPIAGNLRPGGLRRLADLVESGALRVLVDREHPFDEVAAAFAAYGRETIGNIVVVIG